MRIFENMNLDPSIVEFTHPSAQFKFTKKSNQNFFYTNEEFTKGIRLWNDLKWHKRKFICNEGQYIDYLGDLPKVADLYFWGEWEAQSYFELLKWNKDMHFPNAIHKPFYNFDKGNKKTHTTDPFVFGEKFYFTHCKQKSRINVLCNLAHKSLILFGTEYSDGFALDTVFVVDEMRRKDSEKDYFVNLPNELKEINLFSTYFNKAETFNYTCYTGKMHHDDSKMLSFIPCKVNIQDTNLQKPLIRIDEFGLQKEGAGTVCRKIESNLSVLEYWNKLVESIIEQGYKIGIQIEMPKQSNY
jgi:hypothetical protein